MPQHFLTSFKRARLAVIALATVAMIAGNLVSAYAASLTSASLELSDPRSTETSDYTVTASGFTTGTTIRCVTVSLNDAADGSGSIPSNITTTGSTLDSSTLITAGSWSVDNSSNGTLSATYATGETPAANGNIVWAGVTNGDTEGTTYYAIVNTYTDASCTGGNEVDSVTVAYVYQDGELVTLTIEPTLTFSCEGVALGQSVNSATTTIASNASGIDFGTDITAVANGISAHDLEVTTNANGGYNVYIRHTGDLENANNDVIDVHSGTNAAPSAFTAAGTESWGYTTEDTDLAQFGVNEWAGFSTSNETVVTNAAATAGTETTRVGQQVGIANDTPAGTYQTTIVYTIVATY